MKEDIFCGEKGQKIKVNNQCFYIGDIVQLTDIRKKISCYFQVIFSNTTFKVLLYNPTNAQPMASGGGNYSAFYNQAYIDMYKFSEGYYPNVRIKRIGNDKIAIQKIKTTRRNNMSPVR